MFAQKSQYESLEWLEYRWMETGLGPTAAAWGQLSSINNPGSTGLDFSVRSSNSGLLDLHSHHWGPIVYPQTEASISVPFYHIDLLAR